MDYLEFILAAYLATAVVLGGLVVWVVCDRRAQTRRLDALGRAGRGRHRPSDAEAP